MLRLSTSKVVWSLGKNALLPLALLCSLAACTLPQDAASKPPAIRVVTTTNIVADWVENIGGDHVEVLSLVPVGSDPHAFRPGAQDITKIADADLVLSVGLGLEESWLKELLQNAARDPSTIVELGEIVDPIEFAESPCWRGRNPRRAQPRRPRGGGGRDRPGRLPWRRSKSCSKLPMATKMMKMTGKKRAMAMKRTTRMKRTMGMMRTTEMKRNCPPWCSP